MIDGATGSCITGSSLVPKKKQEPCQQHPVRLESQDTRWKPGNLQTCHSMCFQFHFQPCCAFPFRKFYKDINGKVSRLANISMKRLLTVIFGLPASASWVVTLQTLPFPLSLPTSLSEFSQLSS